MGYVALAYAGIMLIRYKAVADRFYQAIDWETAIAIRKRAGLRGKISSGRLFARIGTGSSPRDNG